MHGGSRPLLSDTPILGTVRDAPKPGMVFAPERDDDRVAGVVGGLDILAQIYLVLSIKWNLFLSLIVSVGCPCVSRTLL